MLTVLPVSHNVPSVALVRARDAGRALGSALHVVLNLPVQSPAAPVLAATVGGALGAGVSWMCQGSARLLGDAVVGAALGAISHQFSLDRATIEASQRHQWQMLNRFPKMCEWLQREGITASDGKRLRHVYTCIEVLAARMTAHFRAYCAERALDCDGEALERIADFCRAECIGRGPLLVLQPERGRYYIAAVDRISHDTMTALLERRVSPVPLFKEGRCVYISGTLRGAGAAVPVDLDPHAAGSDGVEDIDTPHHRSLADCYQPSTEPLVTVRQRRANRDRPGRWWE